MLSAAYPRAMVASSPCAGRGKVAHRYGIDLRWAQTASAVMVCVPVNTPIRFISGRRLVIRAKTLRLPQIIRQAY